MHKYGLHKAYERLLRNGQLMERKTMRARNMPSRKGRTVWVACVVIAGQVTCAHPAAIAAQHLDRAETLLSRYREANSWKTRLTLNVKAIVTAWNPKPRYEGVNPESLESQVAFKRDGHRLEISGRTVPLGDAAEFAGERRTESVVNGHYWISYSASPGETVRGGIASRRLEDSVNGLVQAVEYGCILDGYLPGAGGRDVFDLLQSAPNLEPVTEEAIHGALCRVFKARTPYGTVHLWIDREKSAIMRIVNERGADDLWWDEKAVRDHEPMTTYDGQAPVGFKVLLDEVVSQQIGGVCVPVSGVLTQTVELSDDRDAVIKAVYSRSEIDLDPAFDATSFQTDLPEGALITYVDEPESGVVYIYKDKRIVKADADYDPGMVPAVAKRTSRLVFYAWTFVALAVLSLGIMLLYRRAPARGD